MNIKITEYIGASTIALNIKNVPMTALPGIKDAFVQLCTTVDMQQEPAATYESDRAWGNKILRESFVATMLGADQGAPEAALNSLNSAMDSLAGAQVTGVSEEQSEASAKPAVKRGRPRKTEEPAAPEEQPQSTEDKEPAGETAESKSPDTPTSPEPTLPVELSDITDSELQKYCAKLAAHFGDPKKVFDLAQPFVPEGAVARPTNIKDNAQRHAFIQAAEAASGVRYLG